MSALSDQLLTGAVGGLVAAIATSGLSLYAVNVTLNHARESDKLADQRHLRDERRNRLRTSIETVLKASLAVGQTVQESQAIYQTETVEERDARHEAMLKENLTGLNDARVSLMLQTVTADLMKVVDDDIFATFNRYRSAYLFDRKHPGTDARRELDDEFKKLQAGIERLRIEGRRVLDEMEKPI
jgi:hypothetical protein